MISYFRKLIIFFVCHTAFISQIGLSYSEVDEAAAKGIIKLIVKKTNSEIPSDDPFIKEAFHKLFNWMKEGKIDPNKKLDSTPFFHFILQFDHYDDIAKEYLKLFSEKIPRGSFDGNIFHYLVSFNHDKTDASFRHELLQSLAIDSCEEHCVKDDQGLTPAMYALRLGDTGYLKKLFELDMLCKEATDRQGKTIVDHLKAKNHDLLRVFFPEIWLPQMQKKYQRFSKNIKSKLHATTTSTVSKKRKLGEISFKLPEAHEAMAHCAKKPKPGERCKICQDELDEFSEQALSRLCGDGCEKIVCFDCAKNWKSKCLIGQNLWCSCEEGKAVKKFLPNSAIAAFGANNCEIFDICVRRLRHQLGELDGFTPCKTPDCNGGTILSAEEKAWHQCEICNKESYLLGKKVVGNIEEIPKPWEKPRPCPHCYKAYYEITDACDHITCHNCKEEFNVVLGKTTESTYLYNDDDPYKRIRRYRIPGDLGKDGKQYTEYQEDVDPEEDIDLEALGIEIPEGEEEDQDQDQD